MIINNKPRTVVLGLDGLPFSLACKLSEQGHLPNLSRLALSGQARPIKAELPELSPVNWTSFCTASGPEEHGIFGFVRINAQNYKMSLSDFSQVKIPTIFDKLGRQGKISKVINMPALAPVRPMHGVMIAGFPANDLRTAVHPLPLANMLAAQNYILEADTVRGAQDSFLLLAELEKTLQARKNALNMLWPDLAWDLFVFVLTETDRLGHFLFPALQDKAHPMHIACIKFMQNWDRLIGYFLHKYEELPEPKRLLALADHGFCSLEVEVDLNCWLKEQGWLQLNNSPVHELDCSGVSAYSSALALDPGRIYLHTADRFGRGRLQKQEAQNLKEQIKNALYQLDYQGRAVIKKILTKEELYPGPCQKIAPDLVCIAHNGFDLKAKFNRQQIFGHFGRCGMHTHDDVFFYDSQGSNPHSVKEVGQLVLQNF